MGELGSFILLGRALIITTSARVGGTFRAKQVARLFEPMLFDPQPNACRISSTLHVGIFLQRNRLPAHLNGPSRRSARLGPGRVREH